MTNKFKYPIFPDRTYTITFDGEDIEVSGEMLIESYLAYALYIGLPKKI